MAERPDPTEAARIVRSLGHEVGNLLAAIRLSAHLLASDAEERHAEACGEIQDLAARAGALLAHLRPLLGGAADIDRSRLTAREILDGLARTLAEHGPRVKVAGTSEELGSVRADADALHHVLLMLVRGALERSRPSGVVQVSAERRGEEVVLVLDDEGCDAEGIEEEASAGRGLDLRIAEAVLSRDDGRLELKRLEPGTRVEVALPAVS